LRASSQKSEEQEEVKIFLNATAKVLLCYLKFLLLLEINFGGGYVRIKKFIE